MTIPIEAECAWIRKAYGVHQRASWGNPIPASRYPCAGIDSSRLARRTPWRFTLAGCVAEDRVDLHRQRGWVAGLGREVPQRAGAADEGPVSVAQEDQTRRHRGVPVV